MRITYRIGSFAVVSAIGLAGGLYAGDQFGRMRAFSVVTGSLTHESALQTVMLSAGTDDAREETILEHLAFEERRNGKYGSDNIFMRPDMLQTDSMFAFARLARISKRQGKEDRSKAYLEKAIAICVSRPSSKPSEECTKEKMFEYAGRLDRRLEARTLATPR
jgi:hypothetical protein